jgi:hypothetical protein
MRRDRSIRLAGAAIAWLSLFGALAAQAHHSFAGYEDQRQIAFTGKVTSFEWTNPHIYMQIETAGADGEMHRWLIECANTTILNRVGWKWNMIREGDVVSVIVAPLRNGDPAALLKQVRLADGSVYSNGGPAGPATIDFDGNPLPTAAAAEDDR